MKTTDKKKKKKRSRKTNRSDNEQKSISKSIPALKSSELEKQKSRQSDEKKVIYAKQKNNKRGFAFINITVQFLRDARVELKKVKWPTRKELLASTIMVLILVAAIAIYLGIIDIFLKMIMGNIIG
jgi:preprotein translocase subunit SecE